MGEPSKIAISLMDDVSFFGKSSSKDGFSVATLDDRRERRWRMWVWKSKTPGVSLVVWKIHVPSMATVLGDSSWNKQPGFRSVTLLVTYPMVSHQYQVFGHSLLMDEHMPTGHDFPHECHQFGSQLS